MACFFACIPSFWIGVILGIIYYFRRYMQGGKYTKPTSAAGKIVIVTGANTGIGKETVRGLAKHGATIYMACRDMEKCEQARAEIVAETGNNKLYPRQLDLASFESIRKFVETFKKEENRLDILINNAGIMLCPHMLTKDGYEMQLGVNHLGHFLLTNLLLDLIKESPPSRIVNVSSRAHLRGVINRDDLNSEKSYNSMAAYSQSKLANILFTKELARRLEGTKVTVNALHPGIVHTELGRHLFIFRYTIIRYLAKILLWPVLKTPVNGAQTTLYAALDPDLDNVSGMYFSDCRLKEVAPAAKDNDTAKWLWAESEKWTKLNN